MYILSFLFSQQRVRRKIFFVDDVGTTSLWDFFSIFSLSEMYLYGILTTVLNQVFSSFVEHS